MTYFTAGTWVNFDRYFTKINSVEILLRKGSGTIKKNINPHGKKLLSNKYCSEVENLNWQSIKN